MQTLSRIPQDWPLRAASRVIRCRPHDWHVQVTGAGPDVLALHGAGASGHSFHPLIPHLPGFRHILPDLPGQGFTRAGGMFRLGLDPMAEDLAALCADQGWRPVAIIGHSAGAAVALRLAELLTEGPRAVIGINAALAPFEGLAGWLYPKLAKAMAASPLMGAVVTRLAAKRRQVEALLQRTGSTLPPERAALYQRLVSDPRHVDGTLGMMAQWDLAPLLGRLAEMTVPTLLIAADGDRAVPAQVSRTAAARMPCAIFAGIGGLGHLAHEEAPEAVAALALPFLQARRAPLAVVSR